MRYLAQRTLGPFWTVIDADGPGYPETSELLDEDEAQALAAQWNNETSPANSGE